MRCKLRDIKHWLPERMYVMAVQSVYGPIHVAVLYVHHRALNVRIVGYVIGIVIKPRKGRGSRVLPINRSASLLHYEVMSSVNPWIHFPPVAKSVRKYILLR